MFIGCGMVRCRQSRKIRATIISGDDIIKFEDSGTYVIIEVVNNTGTRNGNTDTSNSVDDSLVLRSPLC